MKKHKPKNMLQEQEMISFNDHIELRIVYFFRFIICNFFYKRYNFPKFWALNHKKIYDY